MYLQYFGLAETPFAITPDPAFVYLSDRHRDALAHLLFGVGQGGSGGFVQLTGEVGTGKTTLCRCMLEQVPDGTRIALILNPMISPIELLTAICEELEIEVDGARGSAKDLVDRLSRFLLQAHSEGERVVVVIDEAQNLSPEALEQVRLLTNLETSKEKLLQIVLLGQPELREMLQRRDLRQLAQRITARYHLTPLGPVDTDRYVRHRMSVAGAQRSLFRASALRALYQRSQGVPRLINIIADRALAGAYAQERADVSGRLVHAAADEIQLGEHGVKRRLWPWLAAAAVVALAAGAVGWLTPLTGSAPPAPVVAAKSTAESAPGLAEPPVTQDESEPASQPGAEPQTESQLLPGPVEMAETTASGIAFESLDAAWLEQQHVLAWGGLAQSWGRPEDAWAIEAACRGDARSGFACIGNQGNWSKIRRLGWPVVLVLAGPDERLLLLRGLSDQAALVGAGDGARTLSRAELETRWFGEFFSAWPQSPEWPREVMRGHAGPAADRVVEMAASAEVPFTGGNGFDAAFERWLLGYQQRHGLDMDGIVGPQTLQYLVSDSVAEPNLMTEWSGRP